MTVDESIYEALERREEIVGRVVDNLRDKISAPKP